MKNTSDKIDNLAKTLIEIIHSQSGRYSGSYRAGDLQAIKEALQALFPNDNEESTLLSSKEQEILHNPDNAPTPPYEVEYENRTPDNLDLNTLLAVKRVFSIHSDMSCMTNGYRSLLDMIEKVSTQENDPVPEGFVRCDIPVGSQIICPPNTDVSSAGKTEALIDKLKPITLQFNKTMDEVKNMDHPNPVTIITQEELNQFKAVEKEKTETLEKHLFGGKENSQQDKPKFPPVMYSPDGRKYEYKSERTVASNRVEARYEGVSVDGKKTSWFYTPMVENGFTEHPPMRSREELKARLDMIIKYGEPADALENRERIEVLKWVLNEE